MKVLDMLGQYRDDPRIVITESSRCVTYHELYAKSGMVADWIKAREVQNECVVLYAPNSIDYAVAYFGILMSQNVVVPVDSKATSFELLTTLEYCEAHAILVERTTIMRAVESVKNYEEVCYVIDIETGQVFKHEGQGRYSSPEMDFMKNDIALMLHTSGSTSQPKRVMLTNENLLNNVESNIQSLELSRHDKVLIMLPMCFGYCNTAQFLTHIQLGASIIIHRTPFFPEDFMNAVSKYKITNFTAVPYMLEKLAKYRRSPCIDISSLRYICFGGGGISKDTLNTVMHTFPEVGFVQTYGLTECSPRLTALLPQDAYRKAGSVGREIPGVRINVMNQDNVPVSAYEQGEIVAKGKNVMKGYYKNQEATDKVIIDGWLHTGDIGYFDSEGYLYVTGRIKNIIITGGINVYPEELEELLMSFEGISDVRVYGKRHSLLGEVPAVEYVSEDVVPDAAFHTFLRGKIADYKMPSVFQRVESIERTYNGKIKRRVVK